MNDVNSILNSITFKIKKMLSTYVPAIEKTRSSKVIQLCIFFLAAYRTYGKIYKIATNSLYSYTKFVYFSNSTSVFLPDIIVLFQSTIWKIHKLLYIFRRTTFIKEVPLITYTNVCHSILVAIDYLTNNFAWNCFKITSCL